LLAELSRHVPAEDRAALLAEAIADARCAERPEYRAPALAELAIHLPPAEQTALLDECRTLARSLGPKAKLSYRLVAPSTSSTAPSAPTSSPKSSPPSKQPAAGGPNQPPLTGSTRVRRDSCSGGCGS
jgi:hypothetical protein